jgi:hypothetical protein
VHEGDERCLDLAAGAGVEHLNLQSNGAAGPPVPFTEADFKLELRDEGESQGLLYVGTSDYRAGVTWGTGRRNSFFCDDGSVSNSGRL